LRNEGISYGFLKLWQVFFREIVLSVRFISNFLKFCSSLRFSIQNEKRTGFYLFLKISYNRPVYSPIYYLLFRRKPKWA
ncbi:hypothetical protein, partial [Mannheimia granulomatis]|uniref:hypothetical protein n=1 Tax=Mannheimia granulomatis TaxID=85402 RepID=UPI001C707A4E